MTVWTAANCPLRISCLASCWVYKRSAVTATVRALEREGLIKAGRRVITILDRDGLVLFSKGAYVAPETL